MDLIFCFEDIIKYSERYIEILNNNEVYGDNKIKIRLDEINKLILEIKEKIEV